MHNKAVVNVLKPSVSRTRAAIISRVPIRNGVGCSQRKDLHRRRAPLHAVIKLGRHSTVTCIMLQGYYGTSNQYRADPIQAKAIGTTLSEQIITCGRVELKRTAGTIILQARIKRQAHPTHR